MDSAAKIQGSIRTLSKNVEMLRYRHNVSLRLIRRVHYELEQITQQVLINVEKYTQINNLSKSKFSAKTTHLFLIIFGSANQVA